MNDDTIIGALRAELADAENRRDAAQADVDRYRKAIEALIGIPFEQPTVTEMATQRAAGPAPASPENSSFAARARSRAAASPRGSIDYEEVARVALTARDAGTPMVKAVADHFGISATTADGRLTGAKHRGLVPSRTKTAMAMSSSTPSPSAAPVKAAWTAAAARAVLEAEVGGDE